jgi:hypothetical protein
MSEVITHFFDTTLTWPAEIVLSMLLETFVFEVNTKILWRNSGIWTPTTEGKEGDAPHLPLTVRLVASD